MCNCENTKCLDTRRMNGYRRRRHQCLDCGRKFTTAEVELDTRQGKATNVLHLGLAEAGLSKEQSILVEKLVFEIAGGK